MSTGDTKRLKTVSSADKILAKLPAKEISWVRSISPDGETFLITSNQERTQYYLYKMIDSGFQKMAKTQNPNEFDQIIYPGENATHQTKNTAKSKK